VSDHGDAGGQMRPPSKGSLFGTLLALAAVTAAFAWIPWQDVGAESAAVVVVAFIVGLVGIAALVCWQALSFRRAASSGAARLRGLLVAVYVAVLFFSAVYYVLATDRPEEFVGLKTRVDAVYFSASVTSTVGFGDVHAAGQAARAVVTLHIGFNLVVLSLAVGAARSALRPARDGNESSND
jgi:hypothetical protein